MFLNYYLICLAYCFFMQIRNYKIKGSDDGLGMTPGLDSIVILTLCWILGPVDLFLTWKRLYMEAKGEA